MSPGTYTTTTLSDAIGDLGQRLMDPDNVRWPEVEKTIYIQQALRTYNALTNHFRDQASFNSATPDAFYDLPTVMPSLRAQSYTVLAAVNQICWQLLEPPPVGGVWVGTLQYTLDQVLTALQEARDTFLLETGIYQTRSLVAVNPFPSDGVLELDQAIINLRRLGWKKADGIVTLLRRDDQWGLTNYLPSWQTAAARPPRGYSVSTQPPLQVQLAPVSTIAGTLELLTVDRGTVPTMDDPTQSLGVPNDWAWVVIFGALAQLFQRDGIATDAGRGSYCSQRWEHGLKMAREASVVLSARIQGVQCTISSVADADFYSASWPLVTGTPKKILTAGHNIVALSPPPGVPIAGGNYTVLLQVVRNAPVPVELTDYLQVGPELVNNILDYAQHLAVLKEGIAQTQQMQGLLDGFMGLCGLTLEIQYASQPQEAATDGQTPLDARVLAYRNG